MLSEERHVVYILEVSLPWLRGTGVEAGRLLQREAAGIMGKVASPAAVFTRKEVLEWLEGILTTRE